MVEYFNLTTLGNNTGYMGLLKDVSSLTNNILPLFLLGLIFIIPLINMIRKGEDVNNAIHVSSLYTMLLAIFLYLTQVATNGLYVFIPVVIYATTFGIRWYNNQ